LQLLVYYLIKGNFILNLASDLKLHFLLLSVLLYLIFEVFDQPLHQFIFANFKFKEEFFTNSQISNFKIQKLTEL